MDQLTTDEARQERDELRSSLSTPARAVLALAEEESGLTQTADLTDGVPPVPLAVRQAFDRKFVDPAPQLGSTSQSWWRRSGPAFLSGMAAAAVVALGLFLARPIQPQDVSWSEFRGHGLPEMATERSIVYTFLEGSNALQQRLEGSWLKGEDVRSTASEDSLFTIIDDQFDSVHIVIDESTQTIRGLVPSVTTRQVQDSFAPANGDDPIDPAAVFEIIDEVKRACLVLMALEEK